jgi:hypothetical protein
MKRVDYIPDKAAFAQSPEWEDAIDAAIRIWIRPVSIGDRRVVIDIFNAMLARAPECKK